MQKATTSCWLFKSLDPQLWTLWSYDVRQGCTVLQLVTGPGRAALLSSPSHLSTFMDNSAEYNPCQPGVPFHQQSVTGPSPPDYKTLRGANPSGVRQTQRLTRRGIPTSRDCVSGRKETGPGGWRRGRRQRWLSPGSIRRRWRGAILCWTTHASSRRCRSKRPWMGTSEWCHSKASAGYHIAIDARVVELAFLGKAGRGSRSSLRPLNGRSAEVKSQNVALRMLLGELQLCATIISTRLIRI